MQSVLLLRLSSLGDVLFALPVVERLRAAKPELRITFLVEDRFEEVPRALRAIDEVLVFPRRRGFGAVARHLSDLRRRRFDAVIDLQGNLKSALHLAALRRSHKIGFSAQAGREGNAYFLDEAVTPPAHAVHRVDRFLSLLSPLKIHTHRERPIPLDVGGERRAAADAWRESLSADSVAVLHPGTSAFGAFKRWPPERFGEFASALAKERGVRSVVSGGPGEESLVEAAVAASRGAAVAMTGVRSLLDLTARMAAADLVVAGDTGPLHLANRMGVPVVALFGPKDPNKYGPAFSPSAVIRRDDVPCSPCTRRWCEAPACMAALRMEPVLEAAIAQIDAARATKAGERRPRFKGC
ncbi:MAG: glycosyltransferase family 9 protein [Planctomycetes bacterium]|nr:glycosyltransferase family 9 protein [Planctomycetota bacterium]